MFEHAAGKGEAKGEGRGRSLMQKEWRASGCAGRWRERIHGLLGEEGRDEGDEGRERDWWVLDRQKTKVHRSKMAVDWTTLKVTHSHRGEASESAAYGVCVPADLAETSCPVIYFGILRDDDFDENRRTGKFQAGRFQNRCWDCVISVASFSLCEELREIRIIERRFIEKIRFSNWVIGR